MPLNLYLQNLVSIILSYAFPFFLVFISYTTICVSWVQKLLTCLFVWPWFTRGSLLTQRKVLKIELDAVWLWLNRGSRGAERGSLLSTGTCLVKCARTRPQPARRRRGGMGVVASSCSTLTLCQQVESVIAVPGEGVRARTPVTNHRLPPLGSWSRIVFLEGKHSNPSELSKSIHDAETLPSGIFYVPGSELLLMYLLLCFFSLSRFDHFYMLFGEKKDFC